MKKFRWIVIIFLACLSVFVSVQYYLNTGGDFNVLEKGFLIFENSFKTFIGNSPLSLSNVASTPLSKNVLYDNIVFLIYAIVIILAPLLLGVTAITAFKSVEIKLNSYLFRLYFNGNTENTIIFGYNRYVKELLDNEMNDGSIKTSSKKANEKKKKIIVILNSEFAQSCEKDKKDFAKEMSEKDQVDYFYRNVWIVNEDFSKCFLKDFNHYMKYINNIVFFDEDAFDNYVKLLSVLKKLVDIDKSDKNVVKKKLYCFAEDYHSKIMINDYLDDAIKVDNSVVETKKNNENNSLRNIVADYNVFDLSSLRMRKYFNTNENHLIKNYTKPDIHNVIVGFGRLGNAVYDELINRSVYNTSGKIRIDILSKEIEDEMNYVLNRIDAEYIEEEVVQDNNLRMHLSLPGRDKTKCDGELDIYFWSALIEHKDFYDIFERINKQKFAIDNIFVCTRKESTTMRVLKCIKDLRVKNESMFVSKASVTVRLENKNSMPEVKDLNDILDRRYFDCKIIPPVTDVLDFDSIRDEKNTKYVIAYNYIYNELSNAVYSINKGDNKALSVINEAKMMELKDSLYNKNSDEEHEALKSWKDQIYIKRDSTWWLALHNNVKKDLIENGVYSRKVIMNQLENLKKEKFNSLADIESYIAKNENTELFEFIRIEHRRWNYITAFQGFKYKDSCGDEELCKRNKEKFQHDCLLSYKELVRKKPDVVLYDLIPLIYACYVDRVSTNDV